ncbi:MAG: hypothetical protein HKN27_07995 [Silicimonas sp.]|nr:hypothetical protein [Silicimonas sp.]
MSRSDQSGFEDRLKRIQKGGANTMGEVHIGPRDEVRANKKGRKSRPSNTVRIKQKNKKTTVLGEGSNSALVPLALMFGALSMFVGQAAAFHFFQDGGLAPITPPEVIAPYIQYAPLAIGGTLAALFMWTFRLSGFLRSAALIAGCAAVFVYHVELVQKVPGLYTGFFTKEYVASVLTKV